MALSPAQAQFNGILEGRRLFFGCCVRRLLVNVPGMTPIAVWAAVAALIVFSGASFFFALAETSLFSLGKWQLRQLEERAPGPGKNIGRLLAEPQELLAMLVLGNSFASGGAGLDQFRFALVHDSRRPASGRPIRCGIPGIVGNGVSARRIGRRRKGNHSANHQPGSAPGP